MLDNENQNAAREMWENAKAIYIMSLKTPEEKSQATRYLGMVSEVQKEGNVFTIFTANQFTANLIAQEYINKLKGSFLMSGADDNISIEVKFNPETAPITKPISPSSYLPQFQQPVVAATTMQHKSTIALNEEYTFEEFVSGPSNSFAIAAAKAVVTNPGRSGYNPLFIHGGTGLGKTHLMQAIGNELKRKNPNLFVCYLTAEEYLNEYVNYMKDDNLHKFREKYRSVDILLLDDVQFFHKGGAVQEEFFNTFNALKEKKKQIVMTSDVAPKNLPSSIESRLISRFEGGMLQQIDSPNYETRLAILKKKCESLTVRIPDTCLEYIADNIKSHVRAMEGALATIEVYISANPSEIINKQILDDKLGDFIKKEASLKLLTLEEIQSACAKKYNCTIADILCHERTQSIVTPRQLAMYISRKYTTRGLQEIATAFGKKHATIISGVKTIQQRLATEADLKNSLEEILNSLGYKLSDMIY